MSTHVTHEKPILCDPDGNKDTLSNRLLHEIMKTMQNNAKMPFLVRHCQFYSLSAMAIVFGIGTVLAGLVLLVVALIVNSNGSSSPVVGYISAAIWFCFTIWLWVTLVLIGKTDRKLRVSDSDLLALQALAFINVFGHALFASSRERADWHQVSLIFEWIIIAFHILYFLLALCVWVRLPLRAYIAFALMLASAIYQTAH
jgi:hypothetical protein